MRLNPWLLLRHGEEFIDQTVPHEIAHWLIFCLYGREARPHGAQWRQLMELFGAEPRRCHDYDLKEIPQRRMSRHIATTAIVRSISLAPCATIVCVKVKPIFVGAALRYAKGPRLAD